MIVKSNWWLVEVKISLDLVDTNSWFINVSQESIINIMLNRKEMHLAKKIRQYRKEAGLTQEVLAEKLGLSSKYIQFIENGRRRPSLKVVYKIAEILNVDVCKLFCQESNLKK